MLLPCARSSWGSVPLGKHHWTSPVLWVSQELVEPRRQDADSALLALAAAAVGN